ncbi:unnamed protein product [Soboliphyme baturini]|uniref:Transcriptional regulator n=1 Tax=Soboliphyme baturini TaxID=241478 RepID=A0A183IXR6_9BILA|nr:unnamed protein product [Soboliphyme baturini]
MNEFRMVEVNMHVTTLLNSVESATGTVLKYLKQYEQCSCPAEQAIAGPEEQKNFDDNELHLAMLSKTLVDLNSRLDDYTHAIDERVKFYEHCD